MVRSSVLYTSAQVVGLGLGLANAIIISRLLGPSGRGIVSLAIVLTGLATTFATLGFATSFAFFAGKRTYPTAQVVGAMLVSAVTLGGACMLVILVLSAPLLSTILAGMQWIELLVTAASMPFAFLSLFLLTFLTGAGRALRAARLQIGASVMGTALLAIVLGPAHGGVTGGIVAIAMTSALVASWYLAVVAREHGIAFSGCRTVVTAAARYGLQVYPGSLSGQFWLRADVFVLNLFAGAAAVGQYSLAASLAEKVWVLDSSVSQVTLHKVIGASGEEAARLVAITTRNVLFVAGIGCIALALIAPWFVPLVFGADFAPAVGPLWLLLPGVLAIATARPMSSYFFGQMGRPAITSGVSIVTAAVAVAAYLALIPPYGAVGAAAGSSIAYLVPLVAYIPLFRKFTGVGARELLLLTRQDVEGYRRMAASVLRLGRKPTA